jgi:hypothetical protein
MSFIQQTVPAARKNSAVDPTTGHFEGGAK